MDVSYTDHSHVIGKGGNNIKRVMQETGCHIHFPDSNRSSSLEKSNQVCFKSLILPVLVTYTYTCIFRQSKVLYNFA